VLRPGVGDLSDATRAHYRIPPPGHPEGYLEAFGNLYRNFALTLRSRLKGETPNPLYTDFPGVYDGVRGLAFIETLIQSNNSDRKWTKFIE
jgi:hypothetical protein